MTNVRSLIKKPATLLSLGFLAAVGGVTCLTVSWQWAQAQREKDIYAIFHRYSDALSALLMAGVILMIVSLIMTSFGWYYRGIKRR